MNILTIPAHYIRLAQSCQAHKDIRYYLNGFLLSLDGHIVGTDGHRLAKTTHDDPNYLEALKAIAESRDDIQDVILDIQGKIPKSAVTCVFDLDTNVVNCIGNTGLLIKQLVFETVTSAKYPDWQRVIPSPDSAEPTECIGLNPAYLAAASVFTENSRTKYPYVSFTFHGPMNPIIIKPNGDSDFPADTLMVVMPYRMG